MKKTDLPGGWPPDPIGYRQTTPVPFSLQVLPRACRGMGVLAWDSPHVWATYYLIIHVARQKGLAYGMPIPWYLCLRLTATNIGRWLLFHLRRLAWRKPPPSTGEE